MNPKRNFDLIFFHFDPLRGSSLGCTQMFNFILRNQIMNTKAEIVFVGSWHLKTSGKVVLHVEDVG